VLRELYLVRDRRAREIDRPPFKVMEDDILIEIARALPESPADLAAAGMSGKQIRLWGESILTAVRRGSDAPLVKRKRNYRPSDAVLKRLDKLKDWRKKVAKDMGVESDIVLPKPYLQLLAQRPPRNPHDLEAVLVESPWRYKTFGTQILKVVQDAA